MKDSLLKKLQSLVDRHQEIAALLSDADIIADQKKFQKLSKEYAQLEPVVTCFSEYSQCQQTIVDAMEMQKESDPELREMAEEELQSAKARLVELEAELQVLLLPRDPDDDKDTFVEIRAGTGGDEASIFAGDLARMYMRFAEKKKWRVETMSSNEGEHGGYKEIIFKVAGDDVYSQLKFESGAHRVQRVPETESQGRVHTSACTVAVLPAAEEVSEVDINPADLKIDTFRSSGAGGQHVNTTDSAVRITHLPTGVVVECQDERSQHKNRAKAMSVLQARILAAEKEKQQKAQDSTRRNLVGSGDRSERIRTYNFPQGRVTDHRINLTLYKLDDVIQGDLDQVVKPLIQEHQADLLAAVDE